MEFVMVCTQAALLAFSLASGYRFASSVTAVALVIGVNGWMQQ